MTHRQALWQGEDQSLRNLKRAVKLLRKFGLDSPKAKALLTEIEDVLFY